MAGFFTIRKGSDKYGKGDLNNESGGPGLELKYQYELTVFNIDVQIIDSYRCCVCVNICESQL